MYRDEHGQAYSKDEVTLVYKLTSEWSDRLAAQEYTLITLIEFPTGDRTRSSAVTGDAEWAKRIAEHYNIVEETK